MVYNNVPSGIEEQEVKLDNSIPVSATEKEHVCPIVDKQEVETASSNIPLTVENQEIKMDDIKLALDKEKLIGTATSEMEYRVELFNRLTHTCFNKCVEKRFKEGELHLGENSCVDRCVSKYWQVNNIIGHVLAYGRRGV